MKKCLLIGGAGFIGSNLAELLVQSNRHVTIIDRKDMLDKNLYDKVSFIKADFTETDFLQKIVKINDEIVFLAYNSNPVISVSNPLYDIQSNLEASMKLFEIAVKSNIEKFLVVSSGGAIYGKHKYLPIDESHPTNPISPYGITKLALEKYALMYHVLNDLPIICIRPANPYGPGQIPFAGQGFVATAMASIQKNIEFPMYGKKGVVRDYIYIDDLSKAFLSILEFGKVGEVYNIGTGIGLSNREIVEYIISIDDELSSKLKIQYLPERKFDVPINILNCDKIMHDVNWKAEVSFKEGMCKTWSWISSQM